MQKIQTPQKPSFGAAVTVYLLGAVLLQPLFWMSPDHEQKIRMAYLWPSVVAVFGALLWNTLANRKNLGKAAVGFLIPLWLWVTTVVNGDPYLLYNQKFILGIFLVFGICFPAFVCATQRQRVRGLKIVGYGAVLICTAIACLGLYATYESVQIPSPFSHSYIGITAGRLWAFSRHPNEIAATFLAAFLLAAYLIADAKRISLKVVLGLCCVFLFAGIALTDSWTSRLALSAGLGLLAALLLTRYLRLSGRVLRSAVVCALTIGVFALSVFAQGGVLTLVSGAARQNAQNKAAALQEEPAQSQAAVGQETTAQSGMTEQPSPEASIRAGREDAFNASTFSGRTEIWASGLTAIKAQPSILLLGMTDGQAAKVPLSLGRTIYHMHNTWMEMLLLGGIPGLALHLWFCAMVILRCARLFFAENAPFSLRMLAVAPAALLIPCLMEIYPSFSGTMVDMLFAMMTGAVIGWEKAYVPAVTPPENN